MSRPEFSFLETPPGLAAEICRRLPPGARSLLGVGGAAGEVAARLRSEHPGLQTRTAGITDLEELRRRNEKFDVLLLAGTLTRVPDPFEILGAASVLAGAGGRLIVTAGNAACAPLIEALIGGRFPPAAASGEPPAPLRWLTRTSLRELLEESGFLGVAVEPVSVAAGSAPFFAALREAGIAFLPEELAPLHWIATAESPAT